jgi:hypothetical protein
MIALIDRTQQAGIATTLHDFCSEDMQFELPPYFRVSVASWSLIRLMTQSRTRPAPFMHLLLKIPTNLHDLFYEEVVSKNEPKN